jgi:hypothetical protein
LNDTPLISTHIYQEVVRKAMLREASNK